MIYYPPLVPDLEYWIFRIFLFYKHKFTHTSTVTKILGISPTKCLSISNELINDGFLRARPKFIKWDGENWKINKR